jgi:hypothetical protein
VPLPEDLVLDHLHLVLALPVTPQLQVLPDVLQEDLLYLATLRLRHGLRRTLGRGRRVDVARRRALGLKVVQLVTAALETHLLTAALETLQVLHAELGQVGEGTQERHAVGKVSVLVVVLEVELLQVDEGVGDQGVAAAGGVAFQVVLDKDQVVLQLVDTRLQLFVLLPRPQALLQQVVRVQDQPP